MKITNNLTNNFRIDSNFPIKHIFICNRKLRTIVMLVMMTC